MAEPEVSQELFNTEELQATEDIDLVTANNNEPSEIIENTEIEHPDEIEELEALENEIMEGIDEDNVEDLVDDEQILETEQTEETEATTKKKADKPTQDRLTNLPIAKIKKIIKLDPDVELVNAEAVFLITKTTELFIKSLAKEAFGYAAQNKKKTIAKNHVESALTNLPVEL